MNTITKTRLLQRLNRQDGGWIEKRANALSAVQQQEMTKEAGFGESLLAKITGKEFTPEHQQKLESLLDAHGIPKHPETVAKFEDLLRGSKSAEEAAETGAKAGVKEWLLKHRGKLGLGAVGIGGLYLAGRTLANRQQQPDAEDMEHSDVSDIPANHGGF